MPLEMLQALLHLQASKKLPRLQSLLLFRKVLMKKQLELI
jgi:hypothetical protein